MGEDPKDIEETCELDDFASVFDNCSIFHYFAGEPEIIEVIYSKFDSE